MTSREEVVSTVADALNSRQAKIPHQPGFMGESDADGAAVNTNRENYYWVRYPYANSTAVPTLCVAANVPKVAGFKVKVGRLPWIPDKDQVLGPADERLDGVNPAEGSIVYAGTTAGYSVVEGSAANARLYGLNPIYIDSSQVLPLSIQPSTGLNIQVMPGTLANNAPVAYQIVDLSAHVPVSGARYVLVSFDPTGAVVLTDGTVNAGGAAALTNADIPATPAGNVRSGAVMLYAGQTAIVRTRAENDFLDLRSTATTSSGHTIEVNGVPFTQRTNLDFVGTIVTGADDATNDATIVTIDNSGAGWLQGWRYRIAVTVANADGTYTNKKVPVDVNTLPLVEALKCKSDLSDLRVTSSDGQTLLTYYRANDALLFNESNFSRYGSNPIITVGAGGSWEAHWVQPASIVDNGGTLYMYYTGNNLPTTPGRIGLATSTDGFTWTKNGGNPIVTVGAGGQWDDFVVGDLFVIKEGANWYGWYNGGQSGGALKIGYATSADGITWTKSGSNPVMSGTAATWDSAGVLAPCVFKIGSTYYMYYTGWSDSSDQSTLKIGLATSTDRVNWTKHASNPLLSGEVSQWDDGVLDCDVKLIGSTYFMFYQGNTADQNHSAIGLATSPDGITWTRAASNPFPKGGAGSWDEDWNEGPILYRLGSEWLMYYMGSPVPGATGPMKIGVQLFPDTRLWPIIPSLTSAGTTLYVYYGNPAASDVSTGSAGSPDGNITVTNDVESTFLAAAWDDESQPGAHARDIDDASYTLHLDPAFNATVGTFGDANNVPQITVDARGLISAVSNVAIALPPINVYNETQTANGISTTYYLVNIAAAATIRVYIDGIRQPASDDVAPTDVVTFSVAPALNALLMFDYEMDIP